MSPASGMDTGEGGNNRQPNAVLHLVPLIDLLLCCVMFLLAVVAWNQIGRQNAATGLPVPEERPRTESPGLEIRVLGSGYLLQTATGPPIRIHRVAGRYDLAALRAELRQYANREPGSRNVAVRSDDGVEYADVVQVMEAVNSERLRNVAPVDAP
jgi:biopolymer transport protein ExbD